MFAKEILKENKDIQTSDFDDPMQDQKDAKAEKDGELVGEETLLGNQRIMEAYLIEEIEKGEIEEISEEAIQEFVAQGLISEDMLQEKNIIKVKLDRQTRTNIMINRSIIVLAKEANDPDYKKLVKVWKMRKVLMDKLAKKYKTKAMSRARKLVAQGALSIKTEQNKGSIVKAADMKNPSNKQGKLNKGATGEKKPATVKR